MATITKKFLDTLARNFMEDRLEAIAEHFVFPIPLYAQDSLQVFGASCTFKEVLAMYRDATLRAGITNIVPRILAEGIPVNGYSNLWVEWDHYDSAGTCVRTSQVHYVLFRGMTSLFPKIELVEYKVTAFPEVSDSFSLAKSA